MFDLLVTNALFYDGLGNPPRVTDFAVKDGRVVAIAPHLPREALKIIDAEGQWLCPGFLDIHTHYDLEVEITPGLPESVRHGVTSVVMGNCSLSLTVGSTSVLGDIFQRVETLPKALVQKWLAQGPRTQNPEEYLASLTNLKLGPNISPLLGHSALRAHVMGLSRSLHDKASDEELNEMLALATRALDAGCLGISVDMVHWHKVSGPFAGASLPSHHGDYREYKALAELCRERDAVFQVTPDPRNPITFLNILRLCPGLFRAPLRCTILSALDMSLNRQFWRFFPFILFIFNRLLGSNIRFQTLTEPFKVYSDGPLTPLFEEFDCGVVLISCQSHEQRRQYWRDPEFRREFRKQWTRGWPRTFHRDLSQMTIVSAPDSSLIGKTFLEAARLRDADPVTDFMDLLEEHDAELRWTSIGANDRDEIRQRLMAHPHILPGFSDAGAHCMNLAFFDSALAVLRQSVHSGFIKVEDAIKRVSSEPARWFHLDVGELKVGAQADFLLLDPDKLKSPIPAASLVKDPLLGVERMVKRDESGAVKSVFIAGEKVVDHGEPLAVLGRETLGRLLKPVGFTKDQGEALERFRNRLSADLEDHPFTDYWDVFLLKHQNKANVWLHCFAVFLMYLVPALALFTGQLWILLFWPITQSTGLLGHALYESTPIDTRDSIFSWRAYTSLNRMAFLVLINRYDLELSRVRKQLADYRTELAVTKNNKETRVAHAS
ncbi:MAG: amidohydrolase family protein [Planctomycetota bacterium]|nr:amidohydrolase family protein [Planctomycetota bacterium]